MIYVEPVLRDGWRGAREAGFDVASASLLLVLTSPVVLAAIVAVRIDSKEPVFFRQTRIGRSGASFQLTKLRTMVTDAEALKPSLSDQNEADGALFKIRDDRESLGPVVFSASCRSTSFLSSYASCAGP